MPMTHYHHCVYGADRCHTHQFHDAGRSIQRYPIHAIDWSRVTPRVFPDAPLNPLAEPPIDIRPTRIVWCGPAAPFPARPRSLW